jgi:hypothetical protein
VAVRLGEGDDVCGGGAGTFVEGPFEAPETKQGDDRDHQNETEECQGRQLEHRGVYGGHVFPFGAVMRQIIRAAAYASLNYRLLA